MNAEPVWATFTAMMLPFAAAILAPFLVGLLRHNAAWVLALFPAAICAYLLGLSGDVAQGTAVSGGFAWVPAFDVDFSWHIDGLSLTFAVLISGIGTLIVLYAGGYLKGHPQQGRFLSFILLFMGAMLGLVLADDFLTFFVYWELTSITSFLLIGFDHEREASRRAALQALVVTGGGGLVLLAGLLLIWSATGINSLSELAAAGVQGHPAYLAMLLLVLGGAFTKSAQFPLHFWLPNAMEAPTPVSAYLHSATMVKAGVYLLMRTNPALGGTVAWETILPLFGGTTMLVGALLALRQTDLKLMLAYTTVSSLGLLVMLTGFGSEHAIEAAVLYLVAHALFKGGLFMVAGIIDHEAGTRDVRQLGGLRRAMPITFAAALAGAISMAGLPPFFGFLAKEEIYYALWGEGGWPLLFTLVAIVGNALMMAIGFIVALKPFLGRPVETPKHAHEGPPLLWLGPVVLGLAGLAGALVAPLSHAVFTTPMASAIAGEPREITITLVPHIGMPLLLSLVTVGVGILAYMSAASIRGAVAGALAAIGWGPDRGFDQLLRALVRLSVSITRITQPGRLDIYMKSTFAFVALALLVPMFAFGELPAMPEWPSGIRFYAVVIMAIAALGLLAILIAEDRLTAIVSLGIQGFAVAILFMLFGAPDLSFTQFMVETLSVVILALVMTRLKLDPSDHRPWLDRIVAGTIAVAGGVGVTLYLWRVTAGDLDLRLTEFFEQYSRSIAHGANVVNVILVDFRGTDTLGELTVVTIAGLAILALLRVSTKRRPRGGAPSASLSGEEV